MRLLLVLFLIHGMVPALGEVAEAAVHYVVAGHLAHTGADHGDLGDQGAEHGCSPTEHHCTCCAAQAIVATSPGAFTVAPPRAEVPAFADPGRPVSRPLEPPFRPPIA